MEQRLSVITLAVADLPAMKHFYTELLGWKVLVENQDILFFQLNGCLLSLCRRELLSDVMGIDTRSSGFRGITLGYNLGSKQELLALYEQLKDKVHILKGPTEPPFGGLFFYLEDVEGNVIEIAYNPYVLLDERNHVIGHEPIEGL